MTPPVITSETPDQPEVRAMLAASDAYAHELYPPESNHLLDVASLLAPDVRFLVARIDGVAVGCGAVVIGDDGSGEIKRMWIDPAARGRKLGRAVLMRLEALARAEHVRVLRLETGIHNNEALHLYRQVGFVEIPAFGGYAPDPLSVFMEKQVAQR